MRIWSSLFDYFGLLDNSAVLHSSYIIRGGLYSAPDHVSSIKSACGKEQEMKEKHGMVKRGIRDGVHDVEDKHVSHAYIAYKDLQLSLPCLGSKL
jgi:hypothetical protein